MSRTIVLVHGGVSGVVQERLPDLGAAVGAAARHDRALDAVEAAVMALEDHPELNAGYGAVLNRRGELELDAGIADGSTGAGAGVGNVRVRHAISLARRVLEETPHVLVTGTGAMELADGMELLEDTTPEERIRWERARAEGGLDLGDFGQPEHVDTVGAVVRDGDGALAAGSSTGGVFGKLPGRVGDSPIFGAGYYASGSAAVVGTGVGEFFVLTLASYRCGALIESGADPQRACEQVITHIAEAGGASAGLLALDNGGRVGAAYRGGSWSVAGPDGPIDAVKLP